MSTDRNRPTPFLGPVPVAEPEPLRPPRTGLHAFVHDLGAFIADWRESIQLAVPIGPTHPDRAYLTSKYALNLYLDGNIADWHPACWHLGRDLPPAARNPGTTPIPGREGLRDVRRALRELRRPAGLRPVPVWGAEYWRAIVDWAAMVVGEIASQRRAITAWQGDSPRYADLWLIASDQHERVLDACRQLAARQPASARVWQLWLEMIEYERTTCNGERPYASGGRLPANTRTTATSRPASRTARASSRCGASSSPDVSSAAARPPRSRCSIRTARSRPAAWTPPAGSSPTAERPPAGRACSRPSPC